MDANILYNLFLSPALSAYSAKQFQMDMSVFKVLEVCGSLYDETVIQLPNEFMCSLYPGAVTTCATP
jgi:hypothetical protein